MGKNLTNEKIRKFYDSVVSKRFKGNYEFEKWHTDDRIRLDYYMNYLTLESHLRNIKFNSCFELGPGPGTWTRLLFRKNPKAIFYLLDISKEMKKQFILEMRSQKNITYDIGDFLKYKSQKEFDFFFSSRVIEYIDNKDKLVDIIYKLMKSGAKGIIITKNPNVGLFCFLRSKDRRFQHSGQITPSELSQLLAKKGFKKIRMYPAIIRLPLFRYTKGCVEKLWRKYYNKNLSPGLLRITESYIVIFEK